ncbi:MAG: hypothetical protein JST82_05270 [Bacteroidetes bacterium]|nr:hypothetical protein [Bacteroidota bacterium]
MKKFFYLLIFFGVSISCYAQDELNIDGEPCGMHGSSKEGTKEYLQNPFKNRYNFPKKENINTKIQINDLISSKATFDKFNQNTAVEVTGYVYDVKVGGTESCNCKTTNSGFKDTHIELTPDAENTGPENRLIVEVTPRIRQILEKQGEDWSTSTLKQRIKGHTVKIQGWLFYDHSHELESFVLDPEDNKGRKNWRASCWEVHPITNIEITDAEEDELAMADEEGEKNAKVTMFTTSGPNPDNNNNNNSNKNADKMSTTPLNILITVLLGAILGAVGQGIRVIVGLKKVGDEADKQGISNNQLIQTQQLVLSIFIAFAIGAIAGVLAAVNNMDATVFDKSTVIAFITAGYAGTDFIEGFMKKTPIKKQQ